MKLLAWTFLLGVLSWSCKARPGGETASAVAGYEDVDCPNLQAYERIPEVLATAPGSPVRESTLAKHGTRAVGANLVCRWRNQHEAQVRRDDAGSIDWLRDTVEIIVWFEPKLIDIIARGGYKNMHEVGGSSAYNDGAIRAQFEDFLADVRFPDTKLGRQLRPKYGIVQVNWLGQNLGSYFQAGDEYGSVGLKLKKSVKERALLTFGDSLFRFAHEEQALRESNGEWKIDPNAFVSAVESCNDACRGKYQASFWSGQFVDPTREVQQSYIEAQIFGELTKEDVESILVGPNVRLTEGLKSFGVPIFRRMICNPWAKPEAQERYRATREVACPRSRMMPGRTFIWAEKQVWP